MKKITLGGMQASDIVLGCMRISDMAVSRMQELLETAVEEGINYFDHADLYGHGASEEVFAKAMGQKPSLRERIYLQSKCGIRDDGGLFRYDFSKSHILKSVDGILKRLNTDYLDALLLHRPDPLVEPEEVAEAFELLHSSGKVRSFGVSNQSPMLIELLQKYVNQPLVINQLQFGVAHTPMLDQELFFNMTADQSVDRSSEILEYCRLKDIAIQAWSPFQYGFFEGVYLDNAKFGPLNDTLDAIGRKYGVSKAAVGVAWILRHPAKTQVIVGTTNPERLKAMCKGSEVVLTREEWYEIYRAAGHKIP